MKYFTVRTEGIAPLFYNTTRCDTGKRLATSTPNHILKDYLSATGMSTSEVRKYSYRSLRKGGATAVFNAGADQLMVKKLGNWKSDGGVQAYIQVDRAALTELVDSILTGKPFKA